MKAQALTHEQVLSRISQFYHDDFRQLAKSALQPNESIIWAGNQSNSIGYLGYLIITSYRFLCINFGVEFSLFGGRERIKVGKDSLGRDDYRAVSLPSQPLTAKEKQRRGVMEVLLRNIASVEREDFKIRRYDKEMTLVELYVHYTPMGGFSVTLYSLQDGQGVYDFLQGVMREETAKAQVIPDIADQLTKLAKLYHDKAITQEEYEAAKRKLLG